AGLLIPASVDSSSGYRFYSPGQLRLARLIETLRQAGMPLAEIATLLGDPTGEQLDVWAARVESEAAQRQGALGAARSLLAAEASGRPLISDTPARSAAMMQFRAASRTAI